MYLGEKNVSCLNSLKVLNMKRLGLGGGGMSLKGERNSMTHLVVDTRN